ncbi:MAG TPA: DNA methyltransferase [Thermoanaerobaculaceae bacterium]|nr:DNA methyltransferase [Thermoanaerobaculaceae bacterium]HPS77430.1 DNA methyltransferase [Thermoanaerobaculaceae bacterium]
MFGHFGETVVMLRHHRGLSRGVLGREAGLTVAELAEIESCGSLPGQAVIERLSGALGVQPDELLLVAGHQPAWLSRLLRVEPAKVIRALREMEPTAADAVSTPDHPASKVLQTEKGCLFQGDCIGWLRGLGDGSADLVFADPPFNLNKDYGTGISDDLREMHYFDWSCGWLREAVRILRPGGALFLYNIPKWGIHLASWLSQHLEFRHWITIDIKFSLPIPGRLYPSHYSLLYFTKGGRPARFSPPRLPIETCRHCGGEIRDYGGYKDRMNPKGVNLTDVWTDISPVRHAKYKRRKANALSLKLLDRILDIASSDGDLVVDPFGGSGTTYVAAEIKGRRWLGCEIGDCAPILERFQQLDREREDLRRVRAKVNTLFTPASLELRRRHGHDTSRYRVDDSEMPAVHEGSIFDWK